MTDAADHQANPVRNSWQFATPLPPIFGPGNLSGALQYVGDGADAFSRLFDAAAKRANIPDFVPSVTLYWDALRAAWVLRADWPGKELA